MKAVNVNLFLLAIAIVASWLSGCSSKPKQQIRHYHFEGKIVSVAKDRHEVVVEHQAIPGFMEAMTMAYSLPDDRVLGSLHSGDRIEATLIVIDGNTRLESVRVVVPAYKPVI